MAKYTLDTPIKELLSTEETAKIIEEIAPALTKNDMLKNLPMGLKQVASFAPDKLTPEFLTKIEERLAELG